MISFLARALHLPSYSIIDGFAELSIVFRFCLSCFAGDGPLLKALSQFRSQIEFRHSLWSSLHSLEIWYPLSKSFLLLLKETGHKGLANFLSIEIRSGVAGSLYWVGSHFAQVDHRIISYSEEKNPSNDAVQMPAQHAYDGNGPFSPAANVATGKYWIFFGAKRDTFLSWNFKLNVVVKSRKVVEATQFEKLGCGPELNQNSLDM